MKIILAPDKFKGSVSAIEFCQVTSAGIKYFDPEVEILKLPLSDGGDGFIDNLCYYQSFRKRTIEVADPLFRKIRASYLIGEDNKTAFIEMARSSGLELLEEKEQNCMYTSSYGLGELIKSAVDEGVDEIIIGLGGSATNDAGIGMAEALGYRFYDKSGYQLKPIGANLRQLARIEQKDTEYLDKVKFRALVDVANILHGPEGSAFVYAGQKGANEKEILHLDDGLKHFSSIIEKYGGEDLSTLKGGGAAGGIGAGAVCFLNAILSSGADFMIGFADLEAKMKNADLIITGEGKFDRQSDFGKLPARIAKLGGKHKVPVALIAGQIEEEAEPGQLFTWHIDISKKAGSVIRAKNEANIFIEQAAYEIVYHLNKGHGQATGI